jgi:hypothetical protein
MSLLRRAAAAIAVATLSLIAAPPAFAAEGVYGGTTSADEAIVLRTDAEAKKLRSVVIAWVAPCQDGARFPLAIELTAVRAEPGFSPDPDDLVVSRNAKGRFAGTQRGVMDLGAQIADINTQLSGRLKPKQASGRLTVTISVIDKATNAEVSTCQTGSLKWSASRSAGRIYAGKTSQDEPVVVRLDRKRKKIADLIVGWRTSTCEPPDGFYRVPDRLVNFPVRGGRFGATFDSSFPSDGGGQITMAYDVAGRITRRSIRGTLNVKVTTTDAAGATTQTCDSGAVDWRATTG